MNMKKVSILDCTLRDGGYINHWNFGKNKIQNIIKELNRSGMDIIECGFLRDIAYHADTAVFSCVSQIAPLIASRRSGAMYVAMIALGDISIDKILPRQEGYIDGIRLTFHKHEWAEAKKAVLQLMNKGYQVFVQPVGTTGYTDQELLSLMTDVNELHPFAFYLVDTLGQLYRKDLLRLTCFIDHNLDSDIAMGFHSHNNLQLSLANALELIRQDFQRHLIIDTSVYGMGRGVGNLPTELLTQYINENIHQKYQLTPLLVIAERELMSIYAEQRWGYDLPYFISAAEKCHPNYASYLMKKETLNIEAIAELLRRLPNDKRDLFHKDIIEDIYMDFQNAWIDDTTAISQLKKKFTDRSILILAPGASIGIHKNEIEKAIKEKAALVICVNFTQDIYHQDAIFISNRKRLQSMQEKLAKDHFVIATSNLKEDFSEETCIINYSSYLGEGSEADNAGVMLIHLLTKIGVKEILLAGFDGFEVDVSANYFVDSFKRNIERESARKKNELVSMQLRSALKDIRYQVITPTMYDL